MLTKPWYRRNDTDERNALARRAYESLLTITLRKPNSAEYRRFSTEVKRRAARQYGQQIYDDDNEDVSDVQDSLFCLHYFPSMSDHQLACDHHLTEDRAPV